MQKKNDRDIIFHSINFLALISIIILVVIILNSCATHEEKQAPHHNLRYQRLMKRDYFAFGFTNQSMSKDGNISVQKYDLREEIARNILINLRFKCKVSGRNYRIDVDSPSIVFKDCEKLRKNIITRKWYCRKRDVIELKIPIEEVPIGTICQSVLK